MNPGHRLQVLMAAGVPLFLGCGAPMLHSPPVFYPPDGNNLSFTHFRPITTSNFTYSKYRATYQDGFEREETTVASSQDVQIELFKPLSIGVLLSSSIPFSAMVPAFGYARYSYVFASKMNHGITGYGSVPWNYNEFLRSFRATFDLGVLYSFQPLSALGLAFGIDYSRFLDNIRIRILDSNHQETEAVGDDLPNRFFHCLLAELRLPVYVSYKGYFVGITAAYLLSQDNRPGAQTWTGPDIPIEATRADRFQLRFALGFDLFSIWEN